MTPVDDADVRAAVDGWREDLLDLSGANRLINLRPDTPGTLEIIGPSPKSIVEVLRHGGHCAFAGVDEELEPHTGVVLRTRTPESSMRPALRKLSHRSRQEFLDRGLATLHLAVGELHWQDETGPAYASPILLLPVELDGEKLKARAGDPVINPALVLRMRRKGVELPDAGALESLDVTVLWARLDVAISDYGWHADETIVLARFDLHREATFRDLEENGDRVLAHPVVRALATGEGAKFDPITPGLIDDMAPAEELPLLLDADAEQRACIAAATEGHSFVIDGPPGTGKSQTIANIAGCLLHAGKKVLVVSERAAALDVAQRRLTEAGLGDYLLALHSESTGRAAVASILTAALDTEPPPLPGVDPVDRRAVRERREQLDAYAKSMNKVREPLGKSLHEVLGICAHLLDVPDAPVAKINPAWVRPKSFDELRNAVEHYAATYRETYLWEDAIDRESLDLRLRRAEIALEGLATVAEQHGPLATAFHLLEPADAGTLAALVGHASKRPAHVNEEWLTIRNLQPVQRAIEELSQHLDALKYEGAVPWSELPSLADVGAIPDLSNLHPEPVDLRSLTAVQADDLARRFAEDADVLEHHQETLARVTARLGLPSVIVFPDMARVLRIAELIARPHKPEPSWLEPGGLEHAKVAAATLKARVDADLRAEHEARQHFSEEVLHEPVEELAERFHSRYHGPRKLFGAYRRDKKAAAEVALPTVKPAEAVAHLDEAAAWKHAAVELESAEAEYATILGHHWRGLETDFEAVDAAIRTVEDTIAATPHEALPAVAVHVCAPRPNRALLRIVSEARQAYSSWIAKLYPPPANAARPELGQGAVQEAVVWLRAHVEPLTRAAELTRAYGAPTGQKLTLGEAADLANQRESSLEAEAAIWRNAATHASLLGSGYRGTKTNAQALTEIAAWTEEARKLRTGEDVPLTAEQAHALAECWPSTALADAVADWQEDRRHILEAFAPTRRAELGAELDDYSKAQNLLRALREDEAGQKEWFEYADARQVFTDHGLDEAVAFCKKSEIPPADVYPVLERALYRGWAEAIIHEDSGLAPTSAEDRDHLVEEYRLLDQELAAGALADIVSAVEGRRGGASELIRREGNKKTGHLPVRDLFAQARDTVLALKPCVFTSPFLVSELLPPDAGFDYVIVDEASRLTPAEAVSAVYRGASLIVAGDERQLPPTSYYDRPEDIATDGTSLLEPAKRAFPTIPLTTHYRSRHEGLIAFADHAYYQAALTLFPRADAAAPGFGVELFNVDGVYRRETQRDNPVEAAMVAERVLHHLAYRPEQSLGVVTLAAAQADAIREAIERAIDGRPAYHDLFSGDRVNGFFVKTAEAAQGDERDVIILSVGYGYDENDKISTNLGALTRPKGWRRLNVAITRARRRVEVVSSLRAGEVPDLGNETVRHLKAYLAFAEHGMTAALGPGAETPDGPLAASVAQTIRSWGFTVRPQMGAGGHRIDLAVRHPDFEDEVYALGVECDGSAYREVPAVRDRDRLREQVLADLGWRMHRVWSTAWHTDREAEEARLLNALESAVASRPSTRPANPSGIADLPEPPQPYRRVEHQLLKGERTKAEQ